MALRPGTECYNADCPPVQARGLQWRADDLERVRPAVAEVLGDRPRMAEDREFLRSMGGTGFVEDRIEEVLGSADVQGAVEAWRVGEAVAQAELEACRSCTFPWNVRRDLKNPRASHAGAELVGFHRRPAGGRCFAFGEVKTSTQAASPPSVNSDLRRQLRGLRSIPLVVSNLVRYLTPRARGVHWQDEFRDSWRAFCADRRDYAIFGVLVRDTDPPRASDLAGMAQALSSESQPPTTIELRALYFPGDSIAGLGELEEAA